MNRLKVAQSNLLCVVRRGTKTLSMVFKEKSWLYFKGFVDTFAYKPRQEALSLTVYGEVRYKAAIFKPIQCKPLLI